MNDKQIAITILSQIGNGALYLIGAKKPTMAIIDNGVSFKIGKNSKGVNQINIKLNSLDTYDIKYLWTWFNHSDLELKSKIVSEDKGVYSDKLRQSIEKNTGLYTNL